MSSDVEAGRAEEGRSEEASVGRSSRRRFLAMAGGALASMPRHERLHGRTHAFRTSVSRSRFAAFRRQERSSTCITGLSADFRDFLRWRVNAGSGSVGSPRETGARATAARAGRAWRVAGDVRQSRDGVDPDGRDESADRSDLVGSLQPAELGGPAAVFVRRGSGFEDLPPIDGVVISHNHYDHLDLPTLQRLASEDASSEGFIRRWGMRHFWRCMALIQTRPTWTGGIAGSWTRRDLRSSACRPSTGRGEARRPGDDAVVRAGCFEAGPGR
jgi:hypothetical protein